MLRRVSPHTFGRLAAPALVLLAAALVHAQAPKEVDPLAGVSMTELADAMGKYSKKCNDLFKGTTTLDPNDAEQVKALDTAARFTLYRFYDTQIEKPPKPTDPSIDQVFKEFEDVQLKPILQFKEKNTGVPQLYTKLMIQHAKEVLQTPKQIARLNAARVLEKLTQLGQPELADALLEILDQELQHDAKPNEWKRNDGVKLYVLRGLGEMLALQDQNPPKLSKDQEAKVVLALCQCIEREALLAKSSTAEEIEGWRALRREAVRALATGRLASLPGNEKSRPGLVLARVMANDGVKPEPRMDERVEAAIGIARLSAERDKTYQPEYAVYQVALFVDALAAYVPQAKEEKKPIKVYAARLFDALEAMQTSNPKSEAVKMVVGKCANVLLSIETSSEGTVNVKAVSDFENWLAANPPKKDSLFEGVKDATVKPANRPAEEAPPK
jgi:hypothetical protein